MTHNWHKVDPFVFNSQLVPYSVRKRQAKGQSEKDIKVDIVGLWPKASLINHNFARPNLTRTYTLISVQKYEQWVEKWQREKDEDVRRYLERSNGASSTPKFIINVVP